MKTSPFLIASCLALAFVSASAAALEPLDAMIDRSLERATAQSLILAKTLEPVADRLPRTYEEGELKTIKYDHWVSGFFPGVLWLLYENSNDPELLRYAQEMTNRVEPAKNITDTHDLGFMLYCSFGQGYRLTGNEQYRDVIAQGTSSLLTRWNPTVKAIKSWNSWDQYQYPVIIDNMMNLEMLCFMTKETGDRHYVDIATQHANTTMRHHFRPDFSSYHMVSYDTITGQPQVKRTVQGYADDSSWARGQAWGLYGYTMMYRETLDHNYLDQARNIAAYLVAHPNMPADKLPYWDYNCPDQPNAKRDASAAAVMASALIELSQLDPSERASEWLNFATDQLRSLSSSAYLAETGEIGGFILKHSVGHYTAGAEVDVPLTYADYYYVEALMRLKQLLNKGCGYSDRQTWIDQMTKIANPVLENLANGTLKQNMPFESLSNDPKRQEVSYLEAVGRTICGIAPWLELGPDDSAEGKLRAHYIDLVVRGLKNAVNPDSADHLIFDDNQISQPLVDAAFLAQGVLRAPTQIWGNLDQETRDRLIAEWKASRNIQPYESNWLLFASIIEGALLEFTGDYNAERLSYGIDKFRDQWYKGDAWYGDGRDFHLDYYNSLVIHPMLTETLMVMDRHGLETNGFLAQQQKRHGRFAQQLERLISPEGSYPVTGRSIAYRFGSFHALADAAFLHILPEGLNPAQVRCSMTAVMKRQFGMPHTFDNQGWLRVGYAGNQINMGEEYINTGSVYLCMAAFLPLGLPESDPFWRNPPVDWSSLKAWSGIDIGSDHAI
ncbi:MAG: DUF2264 domain-containing protein [Bacteroidales bacterium]|nr:DUF2264 domain-containing protein [Bacteroidales bacterium]